MNIKEKIVPVLYEVAGSMLIAVGIYNFAVMSGFPMTGFSGISIILYRLFQIPIGLSTIFLNIPVALVCYKLLGKEFFFRSLRCMVLSSLMIDIVAPMLPVYQGDRLLSALCTGTIAGIGYAMIYMQNSSTGGTDFIIMSAKALKPHLSLGKIAFISDIGIILVGGIIFKDMDGIIYGMIVNFLFAVVVDKVMYGVNSGKLALIVTDCSEAVTEAIDKCCQRGATILKGAGAYQYEEKEVVMCACSDKEMYLIQKKAKEADPKAFVIILESNEVHGEGFKPVIIGEKKE